MSIQIRIRSRGRRGFWCNFKSALWKKEVGIRQWAVWVGATIGMYVAWFIIGSRVTAAELLFFFTFALVFNSVLYSAIHAIKECRKR